MRAVGADGTDVAGEVLGVDGTDVIVGCGIAVVDGAAGVRPAGAVVARITFSIWDLSASSTAVLPSYKIPVITDVGIHTQHSAVI